MTVQVEARKPVDPFPKPFPTKWVLIGIMVLILVFIGMRTWRGPEPQPILPATSAPQPSIVSPPEDTTASQLPEEPLNMQDLVEPEFPELDRELANLV